MVLVRWFRFDYLISGWWLREFFILWFVSWGIFGLGSGFVSWCFFLVLGWFFCVLRFCCIMLIRFNMLMRLLFWFCERVRLLFVIVMLIWLLFIRGLVGFLILVRLVSLCVGWWLVWYLMWWFCLMLIFVKGLVRLLLRIVWKLLVMSFIFGCVNIFLILLWFICSDILCWMCGRVVRRLVRLFVSVWLDCLIGEELSGYDVGLICNDDFVSDVLIGVWVDFVG